MLLPGERLRVEDSCQSPLLLKVDNRADGIFDMLLQESHGPLPQIHTSACCHSMCQPNKVGNTSECYRQLEARHNQQVFLHGLECIHIPCLFLVCGLRPAEDARGRNERTDHDQWLNGWSQGTSS